MSDQELRRTIQELRRELADVGELDADLEHLLAEIRTDIDAVVDRTAPPSLGELLRAAVQRFEASHPSLSAAMAAVIDQLANIGV